MNRDQIAEYYPDVLFLEQECFDEAIIGVVNGAGMEPKVCYSTDKVIAVLMGHDGMSLEDAIEYFEFNILCAYVGESTPVFLEPK